MEELSVVCSGFTAVEFTYISDLLSAHSFVARPLSKCPTVTHYHMTPKSATIWLQYIPYCRLLWDYM